MVALAHLKKYVTDHSQHFPDGGKEILAKAEELASRDAAKVILGLQAAEMLGEHADEFFYHMEADGEYLIISAKTACLAPE